MSKGGHYAQQRGKQPKKPTDKKMIAMIAVAVVLVLVVAGLIGGVVYRTTMDAASLQVETTAPSETAETTPEETQAVETTEADTTPTTLPYTESGKDILNILVIGQSARAGEDEESSRLADTMILVTVNKNTKTMTLTSFLRDTYLKLPDYVEPSGTQHTCGKNRINVAYHLGYTWAGVAGAMEMTNQCLLENFGVEVDYDIEVSFDGFIELIALLGGVDIELTEAEAEYLYDDDLWVYYDYEPGLAHLDGMSALSYARMRKAAGDSDSDIARTARQRNLIVTILDQLKPKSFSSLQKLVEKALDCVTTNMTDDEITTCIWEILPLLSDLTIETGTCPVEGSYWGEIIDLFGTQSSVLQFEASTNWNYMTALTEGTE